MLAVLTEPQKKLIRDTRANPDTSYDNHTTHPQVEYLARACWGDARASYFSAPPLPIGVVDLRPDDWLRVWLASR